MICYLSQIISHGIISFCYLSQIISHSIISFCYLSQIIPRYNLSFVICLELYQGIIKKLFDKFIEECVIISQPIHKKNYH